MDKRERFEIEYADQNNMRPEDFAQYRMGDTYRLPAIARAHRYFCSGWDAAEAAYSCEPITESIRGNLFATGLFATSTTE